MPNHLSASRLNHFLGCRHRVALWLDGVTPPEGEDAALELVRAKGFEHEADVLVRLEAVYGPAAYIQTDGRPDQRIDATKAAIAAGAPLIYQGAFANSRWVGYPDFLIRTGQSDDGRWIYEPEDAKLARKAKAEHLLQLNIYARLLAEVSPSPLASGAIHVGGGLEPERFDLRQTAHITKRLSDAFEAFADQPVRSTRPVRSAACGQCEYRSRCEAEWRAADSPVFIAGATGAQILKLERAGITTLSAVAALGPERSVSGIGVDALTRLVGQAKLQKAGAAVPDGLVETLPLKPMRGFALLPSPEEGDLFFDMEGDPLHPEGLEYLFGLYDPMGVIGEGPDPHYLLIGAHSRPEEKAAFERLMSVFAHQLARFPKARIYHYAPYEPVALKKLAMRHATMEGELDQLLRDQRFVDLYKVARQGIRASTEGYSLKDLEKLYWGKRDGEVANASDSIVQYELWRETGEQRILDEIWEYNRQDCYSTALMRDWLEALRPNGAVYALNAVAEEITEEDLAKAETRKAIEAERRRLATAIRGSGVANEEVRGLLAELLWFHQRATKPVWWQIFDRQTWTDEELIEDAESLGALSLASQRVDKRSFVARYSFPPQDTRLKVGGTPKIAATLLAAGKIVALEPENGWVELRRGVAQGDFPDRCSLGPASPVSQAALIAGVQGLIGRLVENPASDQALIDLLMRRPPRLAGHDGGPVVPAGADLVEGTIRAVRALQAGALIIQGPPGTGKTYTTARAIVALLKDGKRVAVSSNSHKAIHNVLQAVEDHALAVGFSFSGAKKCSKGDPETEFQGRFVVNVPNSKDLGPGFQLVGGTAYHFAAEEAAGFDHLFVDEAGQVALGNLAAMCGCARNLVLVGDQMQLPQPVQGVHPGESGLSCLDYAMQAHATVPPDRGILLNASRRMHPCTPPSAGSSRTPSTTVG